MITLKKTDYNKMYAHAKSELPNEACGLIAGKIENGDKVEIDFDTGKITNVTKGETYQAEPFPEFIQNIINKGGLLNSIK